MVKWFCVIYILPQFQKKKKKEEDNDDLILCLRPNYLSSIVYTAPGRESYVCLPLCSQGHVKTRPITDAQGPPVQ